MFIFLVAGRPFHLGAIESLQTPYSGLLHGVLLRSLCIRGKSVAASAAPDEISLVVARMSRVSGVLTPGLTAKAVLKIFTYCARVTVGVRFVSPRLLSEHVGSAEDAVPSSRIAWGFGIVPLLASSTVLRTKGRHRRPAKNKRNHKFQTRKSNNNLESVFLFPAVSAATAKKSR